MLGSTSFSSVENDETYLNQFYPTYSAVVGVLDFENNQEAFNIASVVVSTSADDGSSNWFGFGAAAATAAPEPGTFALMFLAAAAVFLRRGCLTVLGVQQHLVIPKAALPLLYSHGSETRC